MSFQHTPVPEAVPATIDGLLSAYKSGRLSPAAVVARIWARWQSVAVDADPAWITRADADFLTRQLQALQGQSPDTLPLYGVPFAVKDNIDVQGLATTAACPDFAYVPDDSAEVVQRLMRAGAIVMGKTNLDQFATGLVGTRSPYGVPTSTFSAAHVSGGSSSGSAVTVARGEVCFALGTDTAGSGRVPAGFNNVVGVKPTPGLVPTQGLVPACRSLDCISVFALTTGDAARVLSVIEGPVAGVPSLPAVPLAASRFPKPLRVGVPLAPEFFGDETYERAFEEAQALWSDLRDQDGQAWPVTLVPVDLTPFGDVARLLYEGPWVAERYAAIADFIRQEPGAIHPVVRGIIEQATRYSAVDTFQAQYRLRELTAHTMPTWDHIDVLMVPTAPTLPTVASVQADPVARNAQLGIYTNFVNLLGLAALAVPAAITPQGLPFGVTLIAPGGRDAALLDLGTLWQLAVQRRAPMTLGCGLNAASPSDWLLPTVPLRTEPEMAVAVVGAHLEGMPLHSQLTARGARLLSRTHTSSHYRLVALRNSAPPKPGLARVAEAGHPIDVEVYAMPQSQLGSFLALIPSPLGLGSVELADGRWVKGFICEPVGLIDAEDISRFGGWRAYMAHLAVAARSAA